MVDCVIFVLFITQAVLYVHALCIMSTHTLGCYTVIELAACCLYAN